LDQLRPSRSFYSLLLRSLHIAVPSHGPPYAFFTKGFGSDSAIGLAKNMPEMVSDLVLIDPIETQTKWDVLSRVHNWTKEETKDMIIHWQKDTEKEDAFYGGLGVPMGLSRHFLRPDDTRIVSCQKLHDFDNTKLCHSNYNNLVHLLCLRPSLEGPINCKTFSFTEVLQCHKVSQCVTLV
jgi:hypothetical protein